MLAEIKQKYFETRHQATIVLGVQSGIIVSLFGLIHSVLKLQNLNVLMALIGALVIGLLQTIALRGSLNRRLRYTFASSIIVGFAFFMGSYLGHSYWLTTLGLLILIPLVAFSASADHMLSSIFLFSADLFIVGSGMPDKLPGAIWYGVFFTLGGLLTWLAAYLWYRKFPIKDDVETKARPLSLARLFPDYRKHLRFAVLLTLAVVIGNTISYLFSLPQGYWVPMTAMLLLKSDLDVSKKKISHRLTGTLLGSVLAFIVIMLISSKIVLSLLMLPLMFMMVIALARHYGAYTFFLTIAVTVMMNLIEPDGYLITEHRIVDTVLGVIAVVAVIWFLKPRINNSELLK
ncbi:MAG: FUSC family protein [Neisseriales bacterium]|nr:MAG: FUSC family protein [Neisseriales bacterium]